MHGTTERRATAGRHHGDRGHAGAGRELARKGERGIEALRRELDWLIHPLRPSGGAFA